MNKNSGRSAIGASISPRGITGVAHLEPHVDHRTFVVERAFDEYGLTTHMSIHAITILRRFVTFRRVIPGNSHDEDDVVLGHELVRRPIQPIPEDEVARAVSPIFPVVREDLHHGGRLDDPGFIQPPGETTPTRIFREPPPRIASVPGTIVPRHPFPPTCRLALTIGRFVRPHATGWQPVAVSRASRFALLLAHCVVHETWMKCPLRFSTLMRKLCLSRKLLRKNDDDGGDDDDGKDDGADDG